MCSLDDIQWILLHGLAESPAVGPLFSDEPAHLPFQQLHGIVQGKPTESHRDEIEAQVRLYRGQDKHAAWGSGHQRFQAIARRIGVVQQDQRSDALQGLPDLHICGLEGHVALVESVEQGLQEVIQTLVKSGQAHDSVGKGSSTGMVSQAVQEHRLAQPGRARDFDRPARLDRRRCGLNLLLSTEDQGNDAGNQSDGRQPGSQERSLAQRGSHDPTAVDRVWLKDELPNMEPPIRPPLSGSVHRSMKKRYGSLHLPGCHRPLASNRRKAPNVNRQWPGRRSGSPGTERILP